MNIKELQTAHAALLVELNKLKELKAEKFEKYRARRISQIAKTQEIKAEDMEEPEEPEDSEEPEDEEYVVMEEFYMRLDAIANLMYKLTDSLWNGIYGIQSELDKHCSSGHLPKLTAGQLEKLIKVAGAENDFVVEKKTVWAGRNLVAEIKQVK